MTHGELGTCIINYRTRSCLSAATLHARLLLPESSETRFQGKAVVEKNGDKVRGCQLSVPHCLTQPDKSLLEHAWSSKRVVSSCLVSPIPQPYDASQNKNAVNRLHLLLRPSPFLPFWWVSGRKVIFKGVRGNEDRLKRGD